jgi:hypothetical protein
MMTAAEAQLAALERSIDKVHSDVAACVDTLVNTGGLPRFVVAERLLRVGTALIPHLLELLKDPAIDEDLRGCVAFLGFTVGDREECAMALLDQIETDGPWALGAAQRLAEAGYPGTASAVVAALRRTGPSSIDATVGYLGALRAANGELPTDLRAILAGGGQWQVTTALDELFPEQLL